MGKLTRPALIAALILWPSLARAQEPSPEREDNPPVSGDAADEGAAAVSNETAPDGTAPDDSSAASPAPADVPAAEQSPASDGVGAEVHRATQPAAETAAAPASEAQTHAGGVVREDDDVRVLVGGAIWDRTPQNGAADDNATGGVDLAVEAQWRWARLQGPWELRFALQGAATIAPGETRLRGLVGGSFACTPRCHAALPGFGLGLLWQTGPFFHEIRGGTDPALDHTQWSWGWVLQLGVEVVWSAGDAVFGGFRATTVSYFDFDRSREVWTPQQVFSFFFGGRI